MEGTEKEMRTLTYTERIIKLELEPHLVRNKERGHKRPLRNTLYDYREACRYKAGSNSLIVLVRAGIPYKEACILLNKKY